MYAYKINLKLASFQGLFYISNCMMMSFIVNYFAYQGYDNFQIGILTTLLMLGNLIAQPMWGNICDKRDTVKPLYIFVVCIEMVGALALHLAGSNFILTLIATIVVSMALYPLSTIVDLWIVRISLNEPEVNFGFTRSSGSLFFAIAAAMYGGFLDKFGYGILPFVYIFVAFCCILLSCTIKENYVETHVEKKKISFRKSAKQLMHNKAFVLLTITYFLMNCGKTPFFNYLPRKFEELGGGSSMYGYSLSLMAFLEIPALLLLSTLRRKFKLKNLIFVSVIAYFVQVALMAYFSNPIYIVASGAIQFMSFGFYCGVIMYYMSEIVDNKILFTAQTIFVAIGAALPGMLSNVVAGYIANVIGVIPMMNLCLIPMFLAILVFAYGMKKAKA